MDTRLIAEKPTRGPLRRPRRLVFQRPAGVFARSLRCDDRGESGRRGGRQRRSALDLEGGRRRGWRSCAAALAERGIAAGDRVALLLGNRAEFVVALFAVLRLGAIAVPLSTRYQTPEIAFALERLRRLAVDPRRRPRAAASGSRTRFPASAGASSSGTTQVGTPDQARTLASLDAGVGLLRRRSAALKKIPRSFSTRRAPPASPRARC